MFRFVGKYCPGGLFGLDVVVFCTLFLLIYHHFSLNGLSSFFILYIFSFIYNIFHLLTPKQVTGFLLLSLLFLSLSLLFITFSFAANRAGLQQLLKSVLSRREGLGDSWHLMREKLLQIYEGALSSNCTHLVQMIQVVTFFLSDM